MSSLIAGGSGYASVAFVRSCPSPERGLACASGGCASAPTAECTGTDTSMCAGLERCGEPRFETRCRATAALGEACDDITGCTMGVCDFSGTPPICAPLRTVGGTCSDASECATGLLCSIEGACRAPATSGAPCMSTGCATGLACVSDFCRPAPTARCGVRRLVCRRASSLVAHRAQKCDRRRRTVCEAFLCQSRRSLSCRCCSWCLCSLRVETMTEMRRAPTARSAARVRRVRSRYRSLGVCPRRWRRPAIPRKTA